MPLHRDHCYFFDNPSTCVVQSTSLDVLFTDVESTYDLVFMDIEGSETFALRGMQKILKNAKALIVEFLPHHLTRVAGVSVEEFLQPIENHFQILEIPTLGIRVKRNEFLPVLQRMFDQGDGADCVCFSK